MSGVPLCPKFKLMLSPLVRCVGLLGLAIILHSLLDRIVRQPSHAFINRKTTQLNAHDTANTPAITGQNTFLNLKTVKREIPSNNTVNNSGKSGPWGSDGISAPIANPGNRGQIRIKDQSPSPRSNSQQWGV